MGLQIKEMLFADKAFLLRNVISLFRNDCYFQKKILLELAETIQIPSDDLILKENMKSAFPALSQPIGIFHVLYLDCKFFLSLTRNVKR